MAIQEKQLGQARENSTSAVSVYSPGANETAVIKSIVLCNNTNASLDFSIFLDDDGTTYDENTSLYFIEPLPARSTLQIDTYWPMNNSAGNLGVQSSVANALTITAFGALIT